MKIQKQDIYHGAALLQIIEHSSFTALNKTADKKYGHYRINANINIFIKYCSNTASPWTFNFQPLELEAIEKDYNSIEVVYLCLVCGHNTVCTIQKWQIESLLDLSSDRQQTISIEVRAKKGSLWPTGSYGPLNKSIPHNLFPNIIFESNEAS